MRAFAGNFLVVVRALAYLLTLGREGVPEAAQNAVLNANYLMRRMAGTFRPAFDRICMHEFVLDLSEFKKETGVSALDVAKTLIDYGMHPPTMYFPLIVHEAPHARADGDRESGNARRGGGYFPASSMSSVTRTRNTCTLRRIMRRSAVRMRCRLPAIPS